MNTAEILTEEMTAMFDENQAKHLAKFFKTGKGEYGEGDMFLGIKVPVTRALVKKYRNVVSVTDIEKLITSRWHEIRLAGFLLLTELYKMSVKNKNKLEEGLLVDFYLGNIDKGNNWDLVDLISPNILGDRIVRNPDFSHICFELSGKAGYLWHQRVAIVSTLSLIRNGRFDVTFKISEKYLIHSHDLIHKATGWMLREIGKRGGRAELIEFLEKNKSSMPRTMLRYAIEKFPLEERKYFMKK